MRTQRRSGDLLLAAFVAVLLAAGPAVAQPATVHWVHDELGRIRAVVDAQGNVGMYQYDAVGNLLAIERIDVSGLPGAVAISLVTPNQGTVGASVTIFGKGFSSTPAQNAVAFNGTAATVTAAAPTRLVVAVPAGATTGSITLTAPLGNATSPSAFTVVAVTGPLAVTPGVVMLPPKGTQPFTAALNGTPTSSVTWTVNGIPGGDASVGTITTGGLFTAPAWQALATSVTVAATHTEDATLTASATVTVAVPTPIRTVASVQVGPAVTGVAPSSAAKGSSGVGVTLTGVGFTGATAVSFRLGAAADPNITVSNLSVTSDTQLTITVDVAAGAATGVRVVQVTTPSGASTVTGTGSNLFTVP
jgi:YD repeat-containing protein